jgi:hypothetical protein
MRPRLRGRGLPMEAMPHYARTSQVADVKRQFLYPPPAKAAQFGAVGAAAC